MKMKSGHHFKNIFILSNNIYLLHKFPEILKTSHRLETWIKRLDLRKVVGVNVTKGICNAFDQIFHIFKLWTIVNDIQYNFSRILCNINIMTFADHSIIRKLFFKIFCTILPLYTGALSCWKKKFFVKFSIIMGRTVSFKSLKKYEM